MNIIIAGGGKVGITLARLLTAEDHNITMIDTNTSVLSEAVEHFDALAVCGNCASKGILLDAGVEIADLLIATTNADEVNLLCCMTAHGLNKRLHIIARVRNPEYTEQIMTMRDIFPLSLSVNPEKQAAREIARLIKYPGFLHRDTFAKGRVEIVELRVDEKSKLQNISLSELSGVVKCKVLVCAVLRNGNAVAPSGNFVLRQGDRVFVTAPASTMTTLLKNLGIITQRAHRVMVCGGGRISYYLAQMLEKEGIFVEIIDKNRDHCVALAEKLPSVSVVHGDCSSQDTLDSQGISNIDALCSLTGMDETNMVISLYANSQNVPQVITKLSHGEGMISHALPLGSVICPRELCSNQIVRYVRAMQNQTGAAVSVHTIADGQVEAVEFLVDSTTHNCGVPLKKLKLKSNVLIASITRGTQTEIPSGDSVFAQGDTVVVVTGGRSVLRQLNDIFA